MIVKIDLDRETTQRLIRVAVAERRPVGMQAEVLLRRGLGLPVPAPLQEDATTAEVQDA
jgi:hypothetical protein